LDLEVAGCGTQFSTKSNFGAFFVVVQPTSNCPPVTLAMAAIWQDLLISPRVGFFTMDTMVINDSQFKLPYGMNQVPSSLLISKFDLSAIMGQPGSTTVRGFIISSSPGSLMDLDCILIDWVQVLFRYILNRLQCPIGLLFRRLEFVLSIE